MRTLGFGLRLVDWKNAFILMFQPKTAHFTPEMGCFWLNWREEECFWIQWIASNWVTKRKSGNIIKLGRWLLWGALEVERSRSIFERKYPPEVFMASRDCNPERSWRLRVADILRNNFFARNFHGGNLIEISCYKIIPRNSSYKISGDDF